MNNNFQQLINKITAVPNRIFLIDGLGALLTAFNLGVMLTIIQKYIGLPADVLGYLALIAVVLAVYSVSCFFFLKNKQVFYLGLTIFANLLYCGLSAGILIHYSASVTTLGLTYFILEILVVLLLVGIEYRVRSKLKSSR